MRTAIFLLKLKRLDNFRLHFYKSLAHPPSFAWQLCFKVFNVEAEVEKRGSGGGGVW